jgi:hypothetical protein
LNSGNEERFFFSPKTLNPFLGPNQPPIQSVSGFVPGIKPPGREVDHSVVEVKNEWSYTSALPICIHGVIRDKSAIFCLSQGKYVKAKLMYTKNK